MFKLWAVVFFPFFSLCQVWQSVPSFPLSGKDDAVGFSIENKGFIVTGNHNGFSESNRLFCFDPSTNLWSEKAPFPGVSRQYGGVFVLDKAAYLIGGISETGNALKDCWKYDLQEDLWFQLNDFPGLARWSFFTFSLFEKGYLGTGTTVDSTLSDCWKYFPDEDHWEQISPFPGGARRETTALTIGDIAFVCQGFSINPLTVKSDCFRYNGTTAEWDKVFEFPGGKRSYALGLGNASYGLLVGGMNEFNQFKNDVFQLDKEGLFTPIDPIPFASGIRGQSGFVIGSDFYFGTGITGDLNRISDMFRVHLEQHAIPLDVFPNPSKGPITVRSQEGTTVRLYNQLGTEIFTAQLDQSGAVQIPVFPFGIYILTTDNADDKPLLIAFL